MSNFFIIYIYYFRLPKTNVGTTGKFRIEIFPPIRLPPSNVNGVLKCYFYATVLSGE